MNIHKFTFNLFQEHCCVAWTDGAPGCVVVDPGFYSEEEKREFFSFLQSEGLEVEAVLLTHGHVDHIYGAAAVQARRDGTPVYMDSRDNVELEYGHELVTKLGLCPPDTSFKTTEVHEGDVIRAAGLAFEVISTPGHSPGSTCYLERGQGVMFTGDTLFAGTIGRTDFRYSDYDSEIRSIMEKLILLPADTRIIPGHGGESTIGRERTGNPFLEPFNEKEEDLSEITPVTIQR